MTFSGWKKPWRGGRTYRVSRAEHARGTAAFGQYRSQWVKRLFADVDFGVVAAVNSVILPCNDSWTNEYSDPRFRIFGAQGLQTRFECLSHFTTSNPALWKVWPKISPLQPFLLDRLKRFSVEILLLPNVTLKLQLHSLHFSFGFIRNSLFPQRDPSKMFLNYFGSTCILESLLPLGRPSLWLVYLWQLLTGSNVVTRTQAWQAVWVVFKIPGFVCKRFLLSSQPLPRLLAPFSRGPCSNTEMQKKKKKKILST